MGNIIKHSLLCVAILFCFLSKKPLSSFNIIPFPIHDNFNSYLKKNHKNTDYIIMTATLVGTASIRELDQTWAWR